MNQIVDPESYQQGKYFHRERHVIKIMGWETVLLHHWVDDKIRLMVSGPQVIVVNGEDAEQDRLLSSEIAQNRSVLHVRHEDITEYDGSPLKLHGYKPMYSW